MTRQGAVLTEIPLEALVRRAQGGDLAAFGELARRFRQPLTRIAEPLLGSRADAEDAAQDALLLAYKALPRLADPAKFPGWISAIIRHRARRMAARDGLCAPTEPSRLDRLILAHGCTGADPAQESARRGEWAGLRARVETLPPDYRTVLHLRYWDEWPVAQIATFLALPVTTVKWRLHYGRDLLRRALTKEMETEMEIDFDGTE